MIVLLMTDGSESIRDRGTNVREGCIYSILDDTIRQSGSLDEYFLETDMFPSFTNNTFATETRAELTVYEEICKCQIKVDKNCE
jgi:hypothetical protein